jgi:argininosuccinate lyase
LRDLTLEAFQAACDRIEQDVYDFLGADNVVARYQSEGSAGLDWTRKQIEFWKDYLSNDK